MKHRHQKLSSCWIIRGDSQPRNWLQLSAETDSYEPNMMAWKMYISPAANMASFWGFYVRFQEGTTEHEKRIDGGGFNHFVFHRYLGI